MLVDVTDQTFDAEVLKSSVPVLIDFWAQRCIPCRAVEPILKKMSETYAGQLKFCRMNVDENPRVPSQYHVVSLPNMLFIKRGKVADTLMGRMPESDIQNKVNDLLAAV